MKPSNCLTHPYDSVFENHETEEVARNIMVILSRTGDSFRRLSWEEYETHRVKDGNFSQTEKRYFERIVGMCASEESARAFSEAWQVVK